MRVVRSLFLVAWLLALSTYSFLPGPLQSPVYVLTAMSAVAAIVVGVRAHRPSVVAPWVLLAVAVAVYVLADLTYIAEAQLAGGEPPFPSVADVPYLVFYVLLFAALARFLGVAADRDRAAWLDACMWTAGAAVVAWEPLIEPYLVDTESTAAARAIAVAYPLLDLLVLLMAVRLLSGRSGRNAAGAFLAVGLLVQAVTDIVYGVQVLAGTYADGSALDLGWLFTYVTLGAAALHPSMGTLTERVIRPIGLTSRSRLSALLVPAAAVPLVLAFQVSRGHLGGDLHDVWVAIVATLGMFGLAVARGCGLIGVAQRHSDALQARQLDLEEALADRELVAQQLRGRVDRDTLTGLASRDRFVAAVGAAVAGAGEDTGRPSIAFLDLDDFKTINDTLGHEAGDRMLVEVARRLLHTVHPSDLVARFGGDEFAVLTKENGEVVAQRLLDALRPPMLLDGRELRLELSIGVTTVTTTRSTGELLRDADVAMYTAKRSGGGWARYEPAMSAALLQRVDLRERLVKALEKGEIVPWYQPVVDLRSGALLGFEVLARWCRPGRAAEPPGDWLPLAEETGLVAAVDRAVLSAAIDQLAVWGSTCVIDKLHLAVNISGWTLQQPGIEQEVLGFLRRAGVPPTLLVVEVTEGVLIDDEEVAGRLQRLRVAGVRISLDDFGTGWSSLSNLRRFPVDQLKLDRSFTAELGHGAAGEAVPAAVMQLARALSLDIVAEGVENLTQRARLLQLGYGASQGYLFGAAEPASAQHDRLVAGTLPEPVEPRPVQQLPTPLTVVR